MSDPGDVGQGADFGADLYQLMRAGWVDFPELSRRYWHLTAATDRANSEVRSNHGQLGGAGNRLLSRTSDLGDDLQRALGETTTSLRDTGSALVRIAQDYAATDEAAQDEFSRLQSEAAGDFALPPVPVVDPPMPDTRDERGRG